MKMLESSENYLETILMLTKRNGDVRSIDIANELSFSKASVSVAMKQLRENGYISVDGNGFITLEESGLSIADMMYERHILLANALMKLGVPADIASKDACKIEHVISTQTFEAIKDFVGRKKADADKE